MRHKINPHAIIDPWGFFYHNAKMSIAIIIVIGWIYVTALVAANEPTVVAGIISFLFYGALPVGLIVYFAGSRIRRERRQYRDSMADRSAKHRVD